MHWLSEKKTHKDDYIVNNNNADFIKLDKFKFGCQQLYKDNSHCSALSWFSSIQ